MHGCEWHGRHTPGGIELDQPDIVAVENLALEVVGCQDNDVLADSMHANGGADQREEERKHSLQVVGGVVRLRGSAQD